MTKTKHDWTRADAMTEAEIHAAALADPDAQPLTPERLATMTRTPQVRVIRRALGLSQEEFCGAVSHSARHVAGLGAGPQRTGHRDTCLSSGDRTQPCGRDRSATSDAVI
jgi:DNA-binding transcriptional regulator YiaG